MRRRTGFTLLEVLMVLFIVGIIAGVTVLGFTGSGTGRHARAEAERLAVAVEMARTEALSRNEIWGLAVVNPGTYLFKSSTDGNSWQIVHRRPFQPRRAEAGVSFRLRTAYDRNRGGRGSRMYVIGGRGADGTFRDVEYDDEREREEGEPEPPPAVAIYPGGDTTPFEVVVSAEGGGDDQAWVARTDGIARVRTAVEDEWRDTPNLANAIGWRR